MRVESQEKTIVREEGKESVDSVYRLKSVWRKQICCALCRLGRGGGVDVMGRGRQSIYIGGGMEGQVTSKP